MQVFNLLAGNFTSGNANSGKARLEGRKSKILLP